MSARPVCTLREYETSQELGYALTESDQALAERLRDRFVLTPTWSGKFKITATSWVGVIQFEAFTLQLIPKFKEWGRVLLDMMCFVGAGSALDRPAGERTITIESGEPDQFFDLIASAFARECAEIVRRGLLTGYAETDMQSAFVRGRLRIADQMARHTGHDQRFEVRTDELTPDILENQLLRAGLDYCLDHVQRQSVRLELQCLVAIFQRACSPLAIREASGFRAIQYHRNNQYYQAAHALAWLILDGARITDGLANGDYKTFAFLIDMNHLFEQFIETLMQQIATELDPRLRVEAQATVRGALWNITANRVESDSKPDLVLSLGDQRLIMDAKYKRYGTTALTQADADQLTRYILNFSTGAYRPDGVIIYPLDEGNRVGDSGIHVDEIHVRDQNQSSAARLYKVGIAPEQVLREISAPQQGNFILSTLRDFIRDRLSPPASHHEFPT